jgi:hypothetical protein
MMDYSLMLKQTAIVFLVSIAIWGCGYYIKDDGIPKPDLIITDIQWESCFIDHTQELWCDAPAPTSPTRAMRFYFKVTNIGQVPFHSKLLIAWAAGESDIAWGAYHRVENPFPNNGITIKPSDTVAFSITVEDDWYTFSSNFVKFLVVTRQCMPQSKILFNDMQDVLESDLTNNTYQLYREQQIMKKNNL